MRWPRAGTERRTDGRTDRRTQPPSGHPTGQEIEPRTERSTESSTGRCLGIRPCGWRPCCRSGWRRELRVTQRRAGGQHDEQDERSQRPGRVLKKGRNHLLAPLRSPKARQPSLLPRCGIGNMCAGLDASACGLNLLGMAGATRGISRGSGTMPSSIDAADRPNLSPDWRRGGESPPGR